MFEYVSSPADGSHPRGFTYVGPALTNRIAAKDTSRRSAYVGKLALQASGARRRRAAEALAAPKGAPPGRV